MSNRKRLSVNGRRSNAFRGRRKRIDKGPQIPQKNTMAVDRPMADGIEVGYKDEDGNELLKIVPAKADGIDVGWCYLWDDGSVSYKENPDADPEGLKKVREAEKAYGYSLQEGRPMAMGEERQD